jgi:hypothetical protein
VENPPGQVSKIRVKEFKIRSATFLFRSAELQTRTAEFTAWVAIFGPPLLAVNTSCFALFSLIIYSFWMILLMQTNPLDIFLHFAMHYADFLGWLISDIYSEQTSIHGTRTVNIFEGYVLIIMFFFVLGERRPHYNRRNQGGKCRSVKGTIRPD